MPFTSLAVSSMIKMLTCHLKTKNRIETSCF